MLLMNVYFFLKNRLFLIDSFVESTSILFYFWELECNFYWHVYLAFAGLLCECSHDCCGWLLESFRGLHIQLLCKSICMYCHFPAIIIHFPIILLCAQTVFPCNCSTQGIKLLTEHYMTQKMFLLTEEDLTKKKNFCAITLSFFFRRTSLQNELLRLLRCWEEEKLPL
jgi:hypothetical protein